MLNKIFKIEGVFHEYALHEGNLIYLLKVGGIRKMNKSFEVEFEYLNKKYYEFIVYDNIILIDTAFGEVEIINNNIVSETKFDGYGLIKFESLKNKILFYKERKMSLWTWDFKKIWEKERKVSSYQFSISDNDFIFSRKDLNPQNLIKVSLNSGDDVWEKDLSVFGVISNVIGISGKKLWILSLNKIDEMLVYSLFAIDIDTGDIVIEFDNTLDMLSSGVKLIFDRNIIVSIKEGDYRKTYYTEIDATTGLMIKNIELKSLLEAGFSDGKLFTVHKNKIYFISNNEEYRLQGKALGILNIDTLEIEYINMVAEKGTINQPPKVDGDRVYVLDLLGTLHIYEENNNAFTTLTQK